MLKSKSNSVQRSLSANCARYRIELDRYTVSCVRPVLSYGPQARSDPFSCRQTANWQFLPLLVYCCGSSRKYWRSPNKTCVINIGLFCYSKLHPLSFLLNTDPSSNYPYFKLSLFQMIPILNRPYFK